MFAFLSVFALCGFHSTVLTTTAPQTSPVPWDQRVTQIAKFMGPTLGPPGSCRPHMGPMLAPWTLLLGKGTGCICPYSSCLLPRHCINHTMDMDTLARIVTLTKSQLCKYLLGCAVPVHKCLPLVYRKLAIYPFITNHWSLNNIDLDCDISHCFNWKSNFWCWIWFLTVILRVLRTCKLFLIMFVMFVSFTYILMPHQMIRP